MLILKKMFVFSWLALLTGTAYCQDAVEAVTEPNARTPKAQAIVQEFVDKSKAPGVAA